MNFELFPKWFLFTTYLSGSKSEAEKYVRILMSEMETAFPWNHSALQRRSLYAKTDAWTMKTTAITASKVSLNPSCTKNHTLPLDKYSGLSLIEDISNEKHPTQPSSCKTRTFCFQRWVRVTADAFFAECPRTEFPSNFYSGILNNHPQLFQDKKMQAFGGKWGWSNLWRSPHWTSSASIRAWVAQTPQLWQRVHHTLIVLLSTPGDT